MADEQPAATPPPPNRPITRKTAAVRTATKPMPAIAAIDSSQKLRQRLLLWTAILSVALLIAIGVRVIMKSGPKPQVIYAAERVKNAYDKSKACVKSILRLESKGWMTDEKFTADDLTALKAELKALQEVDAEYMEILRLLSAGKQSDSKEAADIGKVLLELKLWIMDVRDLTESIEEKAPEYGGLYVPMNKVCHKWRGTVQEGLKEINITKVDFAKDPAKQEAAVATLREYKEFLAMGIQKLSDLQTYVATGLARPDLKPSDLQDLINMSEDQSTMQQALRSVNDMIFQWKKRE